LLLGLLPDYVSERRPGNEASAGVLPGNKASAGVLPGNEASAGVLPGNEARAVGRAKCLCNPMNWYSEMRTWDGHRIFVSIWFSIAFVGLVSERVRTREGLV